MIHNIWKRNGNNSRFVTWKIYAPHLPFQSNSTLSNSPIPQIQTIHHSIRSIKFTTLVSISSGAWRWGRFEMHPSSLYWSHRGGRHVYAFSRLSIESTRSVILGNLVSRRVGGILQAVKRDHRDHVSNCRSLEWQGNLLSVGWRNALPSMNHSGGEGEWGATHILSRSLD
jgi:hypothetical protein